MKINLLLTKNNFNTNTARPKCQPLFFIQKNTDFTSLNKDTVSFKGRKNVVKKLDFKGIDFATVEKYRVDISRFRSVDDLQNWAKNKLKTITEKDYNGRQCETIIQRKSMLKEWTDYVIQENDAYTPVMQLAILDAVTKDLKSNSDDLPPVLNKGVLADTMTEVIEGLSKNPKEAININKLYQTKLAASALTNKDGEQQADYTGWVTIPSKKHEPENFEANVDKLKALSHRNWCTKSFNAEPYLREGDFHIYLENGLPKLGMRFCDDTIQEVQGELNNSKIPIKYLETVKQHIKQNNFKKGYRVINEIKQAGDLIKEIEAIKTQLGEDVIKNSKAEVILPYFGINVQKDTDGKLIINKFKQPSFEFTYEDMGIDENKLLKNVKEVKNDLNLMEAKATNLENLERVDGGIYCDDRSNLNLKNLRFVSCAYFKNAKNVNLESLEEVQEKAYFDYSENIKLSKLRKVGVYADFTGAKIKNLDALKECGGLILTYSNIESMKNLETAGPNLLLNSRIKSFPKLREVKGSIKNINLKSELEKMPKLERVSGNLEINNKNLKKLNSLKSVGGDLIIQNVAGLEEMNNLEEVNGNIYIYNKKLQSIPNLKTVGKSVDISSGSGLTDLGNLEAVEETLYSVNNNLSNLNSLKNVGCGLVIFNTKVSDLNNLEFVGGIADFSDTPIEKLEKLKKLAAF